jgi:hypothetical protein
MKKNSPQSTFTSLDRTDIRIFALAFIIGLAVYVRTLAPGLLPGDSGEFQILAHRLGHAHTTGYNVYLILAKLVTLIPIGEIAYRVNLFSALMAALTLANIYLVARLVGTGRAAAMIGSLALGISATFWSQAVIAEVYTPAAAFSSGILVLVLLWYRTKNPRYLNLAGILGGLSVGVHASISLFAVGIFVFMLIARPQKFKTWISGVIGALLGLALALVAFIIVDFNSGYHDSFHTIYQPAASKWDLEPQDLEAPSARFKYLYTAEQWRFAMFNNPTETMPAQAGKFFSNLPNDFSWISLGLILLGWVFIFRQDWQIGILLNLSLLAHWIYTFNYNIGDIHVFYISSYLIMAVFLAMGINWILSGVIQSKDHLTAESGEFTEKINKTQRAPRSLRLNFLKIPQNHASLFSTLTIIICLCAVGYPFAAERRDFIQARQANFDFNWYPYYDQLDPWRADIRQMIPVLEENAIVFAEWYDLFPYHYVAIVEEGRNDLRFIEAIPYSPNWGLADSTLDFIIENIADRPIYAAWELPDLDQVGLHTDWVYKGPIQLYKIRK